MLIFPRDGFNQANLLKCLGFVALHEPSVSGVGNPEGWKVSVDFNGLDTSNGLIVHMMHCEHLDGFVAVNLDVSVNDQLIGMHVPYNTKEKNPLYLDDDIDVKVLDDAGRFTGEFIEYMRANYFA